MFGTLGGPELFLIFVVALIVFGPRKLPDIGKSLGRMMSEFRRASNDFKSTIESEVESEKIKESMRIEPPRVKPVKASPPATGAAVAAADGMDHSPEADEPGAPSHGSSAEKPDPAASKTEGAADEPDPAASTTGGAADEPKPAASKTEGAADDPPRAEPVPSTVSRQPPAPADESK